MRITTHILLVPVIGLTACNSVLGVQQVGIEADASVKQSVDASIPVDAATPPPTPDANRSACKLDARYPLITLGPTTASLERLADGSPSMFIAVSDVDGMTIILHDNKGQHGVLVDFGSYQLTSADAKLETCGICMLFGAAFNENTESYAQWYVPRMKGQLQISTASDTKLVGTLQNIEIRHVNLDTNTKTTTDASDGCTTVIDQIDFNLSYEVPTKSALRSALRL